ncbi:MAG: hypothetical protein NT036_02440 [Candidatus Omnitrophica bacterium]|nr:hypothetical protein [Candidatus Omnitrophota bacterium]
MKRYFMLILVVVCLFSCASNGFAWSDDVEGMLMPSPRGEDNMSDPEAVMENVEGPVDAPSENAAPTIAWE